MHGHDQKMMYTASCVVFLDEFFAISKFDAVPRGFAECCVCVFSTPAMIFHEFAQVSIRTRTIRASKLCSVPAMRNQMFLLGSAIPVVQAIFPIVGDVASQCFYRECLTLQVTN